PLQAAGIGMKFGGDAGQGDIDDRDIEVDGEDCHIDRGQNPGLAAHVVALEALVAASVPMAIHSPSRRRERKCSPSMWTQPRMVRPLISAGRAAVVLTSCSACAVSTRTSRPPSALAATAIRS